MRFTSGQKPMSSMRSASSRTRTSTSDEVAVALVAQVEQAAGGGDEDVDAAAKRLGLRAVADAAVDDGDAVLGELREPAWRRLRSAAASSRVGVTMSAVGLAAAGADALQRREDERGGLAGAGLRAADDVAAFDDGGDGLAPGWGWAAS